jgi:hypothetical protein
LETERATDAARRLVATAGGLESLERLFPAGFATMAREVRSWRQKTTDSMVEFTDSTDCMAPSSSSVLSALSELSVVFF